MDYFFECLEAEGKVEEIVVERIPESKEIFSRRGGMKNF